MIKTIVTISITKPFSIFYACTHGGAFEPLDNDMEKAVSGRSRSTRKPACL
ncbi:hypothetical protein [Bradyrhizobium sp. SYSU BS000235]|uniref:hypothetical protein n=1 Tax=Bradyrhizobium sp. SYSU BS000235 TaxID=3411332 RepID=UPI003C779744